MHTIGDKKMVAKKRAICDAAIAVAEAYGPNVSKGILKMEERIRELENLYLYGDVPKVK